MKSLFEDKERVWDLVEVIFYCLVFMLAVGLLFICHALTDLVSFPMYEPGIRYPLSLE